MCQMYVDLQRSTLTGLSFGLRPVGWAKGSSTLAIAKGAKHRITTPIAMRSMAGLALSRARTPMGTATNPPTAAPAMSFSSK